MQVSKVVGGRAGRSRAGSDGRRVRGALRREELLRATLALVERAGVAGVGHRAVAAEAGVSLASTTYHFATLDDLLVAALISAAEDLTAELHERATELGARPADELARLVEHLLVYRRGRTLAAYELYLLAARRPELREAAGAWLQPLTEMAGTFTTNRQKASLLVAALDGLLLQSLVSARPFNQEDVAALLVYLR
ncbi:TetR family transcriptional regulator [Kribbella sp. NPDC051770]|uniref:TetR/AcrR family transcriptional regulator n=1 Tax=Kribbella sp. NPDC051770 TaxID=3155413 RepID=UPI0034461E24